MSRGGHVQRRLIEHARSLAYLLSSNCQKRLQSTASGYNANLKKPRVSECFLTREASLACLLTAKSLVRVQPGELFYANQEPSVTSRFVVEGFVV